MSEKVQVEIKSEDDLEKPEEEAIVDDKGTSPDAIDREDSEAPAEEDSEAPTEDDPEAKLKAAELKADEYYDRLLRTSAEFDNYKKRTTREMRDVVRYANEKLLKELLSVVDNLERAIISAQQDSAEDDALLEGVRLTLNEIEKILERHNVQPVKALGEPFDPNFHQAMMQAESEDQPVNTVIQEMQKGYVLHDRLLRPAMVVVSKAKSEDG
ncbi:MAG: nucleotide exchange factor GrpE [Desulfobacteraceae bacterium]|jgi:molecular chaperone GrpE